MMISKLVLTAFLATALTGCIFVDDDDDFLDLDGDGIADEDDNCPNDANTNQLDSDNDGMGDVCEPDLDADDDGVLDADDNCPNVANPDQADTNNNGMGDACDPVGVTDGKFHAEWMFADAGEDCVSLDVSHVEYLVSVTDDPTTLPSVYPMACPPLVGETETMALDKYTWTAQAVKCTSPDPTEPCDPRGEPSLAIDTDFFAADGVTASCSVVEGTTCVVDLPLVSLEVTR